MTNRAQPTAPPSIGPWCKPEDVVLDGDPSILKRATDLDVRHVIRAMPAMISSFGDTACENVGLVQHRRVAARLHRSR